MFLNIKTPRIIKKIFIAAFFGAFLFPAFVGAQGWVWDKIFPGSLSLTANNEEVEIIEYNGDIYAGIGVGGESQVYRHVSGSNWEQVNENAFRIDVEQGMASMAVHNGYLYVGDRFDAGGGFVLRTKAQGGPPFTDWTEVNIGGFGDVNNQQISDLKSFGGYLYATTKNSITGTEIWRTQEAGGLPYTDWTQVNLDGFSDSSNEDTPFLGIYDGYLYASTAKSSGAGEIWRTSNGTSWSQVQTDGLGNLNNSSLTSFGLFDNSQYVGSANLNGGNLFKTVNGAFWSVVNANGFNNINNKSIFPLISVGDYLYLGTENNSTGVGIYRTKDGTNYSRTNLYGFGSGSYKTYKAIVKNDNLYVNASDASGGQIWVNYSSIASALEASQNISDPNIINFSFNAQDQNNADNLLARVEYNAGSGWKKATIMVNDSATYAAYGDPKVSNANEFQIGSLAGYIQTSLGQNKVHSVWDYRVDEPDLNSNSVRLRVMLDDQILESPYAVSNQFSVKSVLPVSLIKSYSIEGPAPAPQLNNADNDQAAGGASFIKNIKGGLSIWTTKGILQNFQEQSFFPVIFIFIIVVILTSLIFIILKRKFFLRKNNYLISSLSLIILLSMSMLGGLVILNKNNKTIASPYDVFPRGIINYRIEYHNSSEQALHDLYIVDEIPQFTEYLPGSMLLNGASISDSLDGDAGDFNFSHHNKTTFYIGTVSPNSSGYVEFKIRVNPDASMGALIKNQAAGAYNPGNNPIASNIIQNFVVATGSISGRVFYDNNRDGLISTDDWGIENAEVKLYEDRDQNGLLDPAIDYLVDVQISDNNGDYIFTGLSARYYLIWVESYSLPQNYFLTTGNNPGQAVFTASDQQYQNANFGYFSRPQLPTTPDIPAITDIPTTPDIPTVTDIPTMPDTISDEEPEKPTELELEDSTIIDKINDDGERELSREDQKIVPDKTDLAEKIEPKLVADEVQGRNWKKLILYSLPAVALLSLLNLLFNAPYYALINFFRYLLQLFTQPFLLFSREKKKGLGAVYDSLTKLPLDLAVVRLFDKETGKLMETRVTNAKGQYLFIVEKKKQYYLSVKRDSYDFPSKYLEFIPDDNDYQNLYYGETINLSNGDIDSGKISRNIPLDIKEGKSYAAGAQHKTLKTKVAGIDGLKSLNEAEEKSEHKRIQHQFTLTNISRVLAYFGPAYGLATFAFNPELITFLFLIFHILLLLIFIRLTRTGQVKPWGKSYDIGTKSGLKNCVIRLFDQKYGKLLFTALSKSDGRYGFLAGKNNYFISAHKASYQMLHEKLEIANKENGIVNLDIGLQKK